MAASSSSRALFEALRPVRQRPICECINSSQHLPRKSPRFRRYVSTAPPQFSEMDVESEPRPRWAHTPPAMQAPVRSRLRPEGVTPLTINADPWKLDRVYVRFLGKGGDTMLKDETKWLAVTHKSFDHGRRGFNDRLAFLGKRIVELQASLSLVTHTNSDYLLKTDKDPFDRKPFKHPAIDAVECLAGGARGYFTNHKQISSLSALYGIPEIVRWVPKKPDSLQASGADMIYTQAVFAIIGALSLEKGGEVASRIARERVLAPMGMKRLKSSSVTQLR